MNKYCIIIPYFGEFPNYFQLFLNSVSYQKCFDFFIITDNVKEFDYPSNVKVINKKFEKIVEEIKFRIDEKCKITHPQKLCDYKPTYGYIFSEYIEGYTYWGHSDLDLIFGDLDNLVAPILESEQYDKVFNLGHLTFYRNIEKINKLFLEEIKEKGEKSIFFSERNLKFDEEKGDSINKYAESFDLNIYKKQLEADIYTKSQKLFIDKYDFDSNTHMVDKTKRVFSFSNGHVYGTYKKGDKLITDEYCYIHLQKRKMAIGIVNNDKFIIAANRLYSIEGLDSLTEENFKIVRTYFFNLHYFRLRIMNLKVKLIRLLRG
ncbi:DUF6625 family protein [Streptococcus sp. P25B114]